MENRTSFERVARTREANAGVIWLPGFPPSWWRESVAHLLVLAPAPAAIACDQRAAWSRHGVSTVLAPAPAAIACDPDPAGVAIALQAGALWQIAGLDWHPWKMDISTLQALPSHVILNAWDNTQIAQLRQSPHLHATLAALLGYMEQHNIKGEQEGAF